MKQNFGRILGHSSCVNYLHRLGFVLKRPRKRFLKADPEKREAFVQFYAGLKTVSQATSARIFFVDEAHFRADVDLRWKWVLKGEPALEPQYAKYNSEWDGRTQVTRYRCSRCKVIYNASFFGERRQGG